MKQEVSTLPQGCAISDLNSAGLSPIIAADPPWLYQSGAPYGRNGRPTGGATAHYQTMQLIELKRLALPAADNCLLFMWTTGPHMGQAIELGLAWGFQFSTIAFVWDKRQIHPGNYTLSQCEYCLVFKKGKIPTPRGARNVRQFVSETRREHSRKPDVVADRIEQMFPEQRTLKFCI